MTDRRAFIGIVGGLGALPRARAEGSASPVIGFLCSGSAAQWVALLAAFRQGLGEAGYVEGRNVAIEFRWAQGHEDRLRALAGDLVRRQVAVIVATGGPDSARAAQAATAQIPIVFTLGADPVKAGLVKSLGRPGTNITGVTFITGQLHPKRLELLRELVPGAGPIAVLANPTNSSAPANIAAIQEAARLLGQRVHILNARTWDEIEAAFTALGTLRVRAMLIASDAFFYEKREHLIELVVRHAVPACFDLSEFVSAGGLMSYGASLAEMYAQAGVYTGKVLDGVKPGDLPVLQPIRLELVINLKAAKTLGLTVPQSVLIRADRVIG